MGLETVNNGRISELVDTNPLPADKVNKGDDHIRNIKKVIKDTFSGINAENGVGDNLLSEPVTASSRELNILDGATVTTAELNILDDATVTTAELNVLSGISADLEAADLNILDGVTATTDELNYVDGVTSAIQDQIDSKQDELTAGNNITIDAVTENDVTTTTITASGTPFVVVGDNRGAAIAEIVLSSNSDYANIPVNTIVYPAVAPTGVSEDNDTVTLPEGTYYFEGFAYIYRESGSSTSTRTHVRLHRSDGTGVGYTANNIMGERDGGRFDVMGTVVVGAGGDDFRLRVKGNGGSHYGGAGANHRESTSMCSLIKFWKL